VKLSELPALLVDDARRRQGGAAPAAAAKARVRNDEEEIDPDELERVLGGSQYSVDQVMVDEEEWGTTVLKGGEEVGVIPPVSGG